uniref:Uncharacterized protein n=1 Tax=Palpitomonas bilix TaxID=652834 RepID=A0A7S3GH66_9EUKA|mmetsp:Transcript_49189/g.126942  ORF Transcript_49189/g.126942 Transcript_49189/m.126942 type:complete len:107 (+) Transcript_49189:311-631(+)
MSTSMDHVDDKAREGAVLNEICQRMKDEGIGNWGRNQNHHISSFMGVDQCKKETVLNILLGDEVLPTKLGDLPLLSIIPRYFDKKVCKTKKAKGSTVPPLHCTALH